MGTGAPAKAGRSVPAQYSWPGGHALGTAVTPPAKETPWCQEGVSRELGASRGGWVMDRAIRRGWIGAGSPTGPPTGTPTGTPTLTGCPGDPGFPGRPGLPGPPSAPGNPCRGEKCHSSATGDPSSAGLSATFPLHTELGCDGAVGLPPAPSSPGEFWGRGWRGRKRPPGARSLCLRTPGCAGRGLLTLSPFFPGCSTLSPGGPRGPTGPGGPGSPWRPWDSREDRLGGRWWPRDACPLHCCGKGCADPCPGTHPPAGQGDTGAVMSPTSPRTPKQDITGSPGGPGCPVRPCGPCGDKASDQHPLRAVTSRIWVTKTPQLQGGTPKHLPPLQGPLYRPARGQSKGVRGCTPLPAPRSAPHCADAVGTTRSPRCPLSPHSTGTLTLGHCTAQGFGSGSGW